MITPYSGIRTFLKAPYDSNAKIAVIGAPYDLGTSFRPGARFGPAAIREASLMLVDGDHPFYRVDPLAALRFSDAGDCLTEMTDASTAMSTIESALRPFEHFVLLGGDHSVALPALRTIARRHNEFAVLHWDAHVDTWDGPSNHGTFMREAIEQGIVDGRRVVQVGIRSPVPNAVADWTRDRGVHTITAAAVQRYGIDAIVDTIRVVAGSLPVYLTIDIDAIDPSQAPGTGTPEVAGLWIWQIRDAMQRLSDLNFVGMDISEVSPPYDVGQMTALAAATLVWDYLACLAANRTFD